MQKYIQKIGFILLIFCVSHISLQAQDLLWSNPTKLRGGAPFMKVLGENKSGTFLMRYRNQNYTKSIILDRFDANLNLELSTYIDLKKSKLHKVQLTPQGILIITTQKNKREKKYVLMGQWYNFDLIPISQKIPLINYEKIDLNSQQILIQMNDSLNTLGVCYLNYEDTQCILKGRLFNMSLEPFQDMSFSISSLASNTLHDMILTNQNIMTIHTSTIQNLENKPKEHSLIILDSDTASIFPFPDSISIGSSTLIYHREKDEAHWIGFYNQLGQYGYRGIIHVEPQQKTKTFQTSITPFPLTWTESLQSGALSSQTIDEDFSIIASIPKSDGGLLIIAEQKDWFKENDINVINGISQSTVKNIYKFNGILVMDFDQGLSPSWHHHIVKNQISINDGGYFSSAALYVSQHYIQLLYNDQFRSSGDVLQYTIYNNGSTKSQKIAKLALEYVAIIPEGSLQVNAQEVVIPSYKNRRFSLLKIRYY